MRAVIQRVSQAHVSVDHQIVGQIQHGLLVLLAVEASDGPDDIAWLSAKIVRLRVFDDPAGVMNLSLSETGGNILLVSQFTLFASTKKGNRPSYARSAPRELSIPLYEQFRRQLELDLGKPIQTGRFGAHMHVQLVNDGPVTLIIDTRVRE